MSYHHITAGSAVNLVKNRVNRVVVTVNAALTGTITVSDETATSGSPVVGIITNPTVGTQFEFWDFQNGVSITPSTTCEITVNIDNSFKNK